MTCGVRGCWTVDVFVLIISKKKWRAVPMACAGIPYPAIPYCGSEAKIVLIPNQLCTGGVTIIQVAQQFT